MTRRPRLPALLLVLSAWAACAWAQAIPAHPGDLAFPPLAFQPPGAEEARVVLPGEIPCFVVTDHGVPVVEITLHFRCGSFDDPAGKEGLAELALELVRSGGAGALSASDLLAELESLAIETGARTDTQRSELSLSCLREDLPRAVQLLAEMVRRPRLEDDRLELLRERELELLRHRFDAPGDVAALYVNQVLYAGHPAGRMPTGASLEAIAREDIARFVSQWLRPASLVVALAGDIERDEAAAVLAPLLDGWTEEGRPPAERTPPGPAAGLPPGVYVVDMPSNEAEVHCAQYGFDLRDPRYDPDSYAVRLTNVALGGNFDSRLVSRIRTREGLAYSVYAGGWSESGYRGLQEMYAGVPVESAAYVAGVIRDEVAAYLASGPEADELERAKRSLFGYWVGFFESASALADNYATLLIDGQPLDYYNTWYAKSEACTRKQVTEASRAYIRTEEHRWVIVGPAEQLLTRDETHAISLRDLGPVHVLELGDPLSAVVLDAARGG